MTAITDFAAQLALPASLNDDLEAAVTAHLVDTLGAWVAGGATREGEALLALRAGAGDLDTRIAAHVARARLSEIDDIHLGAMVTPGSIVAPAALALAADAGCDGAALSRAIVAGYEAMVRLGRALDGPTILYRDIWPTYFAAPIGVAAVAASLTSLDATKTAHALALALTLSAPGVGQHGGTTTSRWLAAGQAARQGLVAARAAQAGFTADLGLLDGAFYPGIFSIKPDIAAFAEGEGVPALLRTSLKPWCAARQSMAATQAFRELLTVLDPDEILEIEARVVPPHLRMLDHGVSAGERMSHLTSLPYQIAAAAYAPEAGFDVGKAAPVLTPAMRALMAKVKVSADETLLAEGYPSRWPARVSVAALSGRFERTVAQVPGDPERPLDVREKFRLLAEPIIGTEEAAALLAAAEAGDAARVIAAMERR